MVRVDYVRVVSVLHKLSTSDSGSELVASSEAKSIGFEGDDTFVAFPNVQRTDRHVLLQPVVRW